ncbi:MAG TPA: extracellular solute-binding protein [Actinomycetota bacterium]|nr:extracellular solute-binding protein [Actinomycetota bacterium]
MWPDRRTTRPAGILALALLLLVPACTGHPGPASGSSATPTASGPPLTGSLQIYADSSLDPVMNQLASAFTAAHPGVRLLPISYEGTQALATSLASGATPDVVAVADPAALGPNAVTGTVQTFASDPLEVVVKANDPAGIQALPDLARPSISVVLPDPSLPLGVHAEQALAAAGVRLPSAATSLSVPTIMNDVGAGTDDAGIVNASDVVTGGSPVTGVAIPAGDQFPTTETVAAMSGTPNQTVAAAFASYLASPSARAILTAAGFEPAST